MPTYRTKLDLEDCIVVTDHEYGRLQGVVFGITVAHGPDGMEVYYSIEFQLPDERWRFEVIDEGTLFAGEVEPLL